MQKVATNIRFSKQEHEELRKIAFLEKTSLANIVRTAIREYKLNRNLGKGKNRRLFDLMAKSRIKIDFSTVELAHEDRKFE